MTRLDEGHPLVQDFVELMVSNRNAEALSLLEKIFHMLENEEDPYFREHRYEVMNVYKVSLLAQMGRLDEARSTLESLIDPNNAVSLKLAASLALNDLRDYPQALAWATEAENQMVALPDVYVEEDTFDETLQQIWWIQAKALDSAGATDEAYQRFWKNLKSTSSLLELNHTIELLNKWSEEGRFVEQVRDAKTLLRD